MYRYEREINPRAMHMFVLKLLCLCLFHTLSDKNPSHANSGFTPSFCTYKSQLALTGPAHMVSIKEIIVV